MHEALDGVYYHPSSGELGQENQEFQGISGYIWSWRPA